METKMNRKVMCDEVLFYDLNAFINSRNNWRNIGIQLANIMLFYICYVEHHAKFNSCEINFSAGYVVTYIWNNQIYTENIWLKIL
jgi:hypothetical protein